MIDKKWIQRSEYKKTNPVLYFFTEENEEKNNKEYFTYLHFTFTFTYVAVQFNVLNSFIPMFSLD